MRLFAFSLIVVLSLGSSPLSAQGKASAILDMTKGRQEYLKQNYWGALTLFRKALKGSPENALVHYRIGETQYALKHYDTAKEYLKKAEALDPKIDSDLPLMLGYAHHRLAELEDAKTYYRQYRDVISDGKGQLVNISGLIAQCDYAFEMMAKSIDVQIDNLGREINSRYDDYSPSVTSDGQMMVFTSRRPSVSNDVDELGDYKYFEDIYFSMWNEEEASWESAQRFSEQINTLSHDAVLSIEGSGDQLYIYKNNQGNAGDIYYSESIDGKLDNWSEPRKLSRPINTSYFESSISITADGNTMYFVSERPGGRGRGDIYVSRKLDDSSWSKPENLGASINTPFDEKFVFIHPNGSTLFFSSIGHLTMGSYDIFRSELKDGLWSEPVNLGYPINTVNEESTFSMTADNKKLLISAEYEGGAGERDIYEVDLRNADILNSLNIDSELLDRKGNITVFGRVMASKEKPGVFREVNVYDITGKELIFNTKTNRKGDYEVSLPRGKTYQITFERSEGKPESQKLNLKTLEDFESEYQLDIKL